MPELVSLRSASALLLALIVGALGGCKANQRETVIAVSPRVEQATDATPSAKERAAALHITADEIYTVYSKNLILGATPDQRYHNRLFWVQGVFNGVNRGLPGRTYIELRTHDVDAFTYAALSPAAMPLLTTLKPGMSVELICWGDGEVGGSPLLRDCRE